MPALMQDPMLLAGNAIRTDTACFLLHADKCGGVCGFLVAALLT